MKTIIWILSAFLFFACAESDEIIPEEELENKDVIAFLKTRGLDASSPEDIQYISDYKDSLNYTFVWGMKNYAAWVAKYAEDGTEIFSFVLTDWAGDKLYTHTNFYSLLRIEGNLMFINSYGTNHDDPEFATSHVDNFLSILDLTTGVELSRMPFSSEMNKYRIYDTEYGFLVEEIGTNFTEVFSMIGKDGRLVWSRKSDNSELANGIKGYNSFIMASTDKILFHPHTDLGVVRYDTYKYINFKTYTTIFEISKITFPFDIIGSTDSDYSYELYSASEVDGNVVLKYNYRQRTKIVDNAASGVFHYEYATLSKHFCELDGSSGAVINSGSLE